MCVVFGGKSAVALWHVHHYYNFYALNAFNFTFVHFLYLVSAVACVGLGSDGPELGFWFKKLKKTTGFPQMYCKY